MLTFSVADAHPSSLDKIIFPGQDYNNARVYDFQDVTHWKANKLDRTKSSRMGWSDCSISLQGPIVHSLVEHFVTRWNFIFKEKYNVREDERYKLLDLTPGSVLASYSGVHAAHSGQHPSRHHLGRQGGFLDSIQDGFEKGLSRMRGEEEEETEVPHHPGKIPIQLVRSCTKWSNGCATEHSIANAYIDTIRDSKHFVVGDSKPIFGYF